MPSYQRAHEASDDVLQLLPRFLAAGFFSTADDDVRRVEKRGWLDAARLLPDASVCNV